MQLLTTHPGLDFNKWLEQYIVPSTREVSLLIDIIRDGNPKLNHLKLVYRLGKLRIEIWKLIFKSGKDRTLIEFCFLYGWVDRNWVTFSSRGNLVHGDVLQFWEGVVSSEFVTVSRCKVSGAHRLCTLYSCIKCVRYRFYRTQGIIQ